VQGNLNVTRGREMIELGLVVLASFLAAILLTPLVRRVAHRYDIVDRPDPNRKLHGRIVARAGGVAVLFAMLVGCSGALLRFSGSLLNLDLTPFLGLLTVMVGIMLLGLADDIWTLRGRQKLVGQVVLATVLIFTGFSIRHLQIFGFSFELGLLAFPVTLVWLLATTNALNLIDGSDGLCTSLGAVISAALGIIASMNGHFAEASIAFALCGALLGFLVFNFPPASIFLGDSGSLLIGMVTGALAIRCSIKGPATVAFLAPLAILSIPLLDSCMAILRRKLTGRSIYTTDRAHLHHSLKEKGLGDRGLVFMVILMALVTASGAIAGQMLGRDWLALIGTGVVFAMLVFTRAFGHAELVLVGRRASRFLQSLTEPAVKANGIVHHKAVRLQGHRQWETIWNTLVEFAETEQLCKLHMDLNIPWLHEGFHGTWQRSRQLDRLERWSTSLPIYTTGRIVGRVDMSGPATDGATLSVVGKLLELLEDLTPQVNAILAENSSEMELAKTRLSQEAATSSDASSVRPFASSEAQGPSPTPV
jgi:UDP-GlcNAc:undecaprenyl-phosphate/decaprenyl-phosphate GlcNAc-1-phosphate transferase